MTGEVLQFRGRTIPLEAMIVTETDILEMMKALDAGQSEDPDVRIAAIGFLHYQRARHGTLAAARAAARLTPPQDEAVF